MILERFQVPGLAQYSFVVGDSGSIAVIDPKRDVDTYIEYAKSRGLQIVYVLETRIHPVSASVAKALASQRRYALPQPLCQRRSRSGWGYPSRAFRRR